MRSTYVSYAFYVYSPKVNLYNTLSFDFDQVGTQNGCDLGAYQILDFQDKDSQPEHLLSHRVIRRVWSSSEKQACHQGDSEH
jgi:hypothetical protein